MKVKEHDYEAEKKLVERLNHNPDPLEKIPLWVLAVIVITGTFIGYCFYLPISKIYYYLKNKEIEI